MYCEALGYFKLFAGELAQFGKSRIGRAIVKGSAENDELFANRVSGKQISRKKLQKVDRNSKNGIEFEALLNTKVLIA